MPHGDRQRQSDSSESDSNSDSDQSDDDAVQSDDSTEPAAKLPCGRRGPLAAGDAWRRVFQAGAIDTQLAGVGIAAGAGVTPGGGKPSLDRDVEAYNYKLAPRLPKEARAEKRRADAAAIEAAVAAANASGSAEALEEAFGLPTEAEGAATAAQADLRQRLEARRRKRNRDKRTGRREAARKQKRGGGGGDAEMKPAEATGGRGSGKLDELSPAQPPAQLAKHLARQLQEPKRHLIERVVSLCGPDKAVELFKRTREIEAAGGMQVAKGDRRRTPGGVYLQLVKSDDSLPPDLIKRVFADEAAAVNAKKKADRKRLRARRRGEASRQKDAAGEAEELEAKRAALLAQLDALENDGQDEMA